MWIRCLALALALTACADPYEAYCADEARCEDEDPSGTDGCIRDFEEAEASAERKDCDADWRAFRSCAAARAVCDETGEEPDYGLEGDDCEEEEDAFDRCMG